MRRGTWMLAISGALAATGGGAFAADSEVDPAFAQVGVPTRYSRPATPPKPPTTPASKNFYDELFGDTALNAEAAPAAAAPAPAPTAPEKPKTTALYPQIGKRP
ncbi:MAG TPA: hypothetical protein VM165_21505, partial [Planctomycetaceae bacterium]|nr:hypothetical protein [Planctomycetaceae bacterium]